MSKAAFLLVFIVAMTQSVYSNLREEDTASKNAAQARLAFERFTGRISKNKVRMRSQPNLDGPILRELNRDDLLVVAYEVDDFYAVLPPEDFKAYIFRTFVLDNQIEGSHVNVRLEPDTESPIVAQLNSGDRVEGTVSPLNSKWLEIEIPKSARFYVCKEYVENVGDSSVIATLKKKREEVDRLLSSAHLLSQNEMRKPFTEIHLESIVENLKRVMSLASDFPDQAARAKELLTTLHNNYMQKKIAYLEMKSESSGLNEQQNAQLNAEFQAQQLRLRNLEEKLKTARDPIVVNDEEMQPTEIMNSKMATWLRFEQALFDKWAAENNNDPTFEAFYKEQESEAVHLRGILEPYTRAVKNKPGDYVLINQSDGLPIAYLYSTKINLQNRVGQEVTVKGIARSNNHFAFPAYFVLLIE